MNFLKRRYIFEFVDPRQVCLLKISIYGLKQASRSWNIRFNHDIKWFGFLINPDDHVFIRSSDLKIGLEAV